MRATQNQQILEFLKGGRSITPIEALNHIGCMRLASRISDLKKEGHDIKVEMVHNPDTGKRFARYWLAMLLLIPLLSGCVTASMIRDVGAKNLTQENTAKIVRGVTTKAQVLSILGKPTMTSSSSLGEMWTYTRSIYKEVYNGWGWYYDNDASKTSSSTISFDEKGVVKEITTFEMGTLMTGTVEYK